MSSPESQSKNRAIWIVVAAIVAGVFVVAMVMLVGGSEREPTPPALSTEEPAETGQEADAGIGMSPGADASARPSTAIEVEVPEPTPIRPPAELQPDTTLRAEPDLAAMARASIADGDTRQALRLTRRLGSLTTQADLYHEIYMSAPESNDGLQAANEWIETQHELGRQSTEAHDVCVMLSELQMRDPDCEALAR